MSVDEPCPPTAAVLLAAGRSTRMGGSVRKPFLELAGEPVLAHALRALAAARGVEQLVVVAALEDHDLVREIAHGCGVPRPDCVEGGAERTDSVRAGVAAVRPGLEVVLVHDVARPLVSSEHAEQVARVAAREGAALLAVPVRDTIKQAHEGRSTGTLDRSRLWAAQTPQGFRTGLLRELLERAAREGGATATDDAALHERYVGPVPLVEGDALNFKLTTPADLRLAEAVLRSRDR